MQVNGEASVPLENDVVQRLKAIRKWRPTAEQKVRIVITIKFIVFSVLSSCNKRCVDLMYIMTGIKVT